MFSETILFLLFLLLCRVWLLGMFPGSMCLPSLMESAPCLSDAFSSKISENTSRKSSGNFATNVYFQQSHRRCLFILNNKLFGARSRLQKFHSDNNALWLPWTEIISLLALEFVRFSPVWVLSVHQAWFIGSMWFGGNSIKTRFVYRNQQLTTIFLNAAHSRWEN